MGQSPFRVVAPALRSPSTFPGNLDRLRVIYCRQMSGRQGAFWGRSGEALGNLSLAFLTSGQPALFPPPSPRADMRREFREQHGGSCQIVVRGCVYVFRAGYKRDVFLSIVKTQMLNDCHGCIKHLLVSTVGVDDLPYRFR